jgi:hypothetical protein
MSISSPVNSLDSSFLVADSSAWDIYSPDSGLLDGIIGATGSGYRPVNWALSSEDDSSLETIGIKTLSNIAEMQSSGESGTAIGYFFDGFIMESHTGAVRITEHPVQSGANISDHAYNLPDRLDIEIYVSDVMDVVIAGQFSDYSTKSISAYETLRRLKEQRQFLSVHTRLHDYENMLIENMSTPDDYKTSNSFRCRVQLREILVATVATETVESTQPLVNSETSSKASVTEPAPASALATEMPASK